jgi:hypothetical protein
VFKLLPGRLPAGTAKFEFQRTVPNIAQVNRGRNARDAKFISIQACGYGWSILSRVLIRKLRALGTERGGGIPAVALTAYARSEDRMRSLSSGFQMHVPKPIDAGELVMIIASLAGRLDQNVTV